MQQGLTETPAIVLTSKTPIRQILISGGLENPFNIEGFSAFGGKLEAESFSKLLIKQLRNRKLCPIAILKEQETLSINIFSEETPEDHFVTLTQSLSTTLSLFAKNKHIGPLLDLFFNIVQPTIAHKRCFVFTNEEQNHKLASSDGQTEDDEVSQLKQMISRLLTVLVSFQEWNNTIPTLDDIIHIKMHFYEENWAGIAFIWATPKALQDDNRRVENGNIFKVIDEFLQERFPIARKY